MRSLPRDVRHGALVARIELRRSFRAILANDTRLVALFALAVFTVPVGLGWLYGAFALGRSIGIDPDAASAIGSLLGPVVVSFAALVALQTVQSGPFPDHPTLALSSTTTRAVVLSKLFASLLAVGWWLGGAILAFVAAFALGAGRPLLPVAVALWLLPVLCCAVPLGYLAGLAFLRVNRRLPVPTALKVGAWLAFLFASIAGGQWIGRTIADGGLESLSGSGFDLLPAFDPATAYASLLFAGRGTGESALLGVAFGLALVAVGAVAAVRSIGDATALWFDDRPDDESHRTYDVARPPGPFAWTKSGRVGWHYLRLARRSPHRLAHLLFLAFFVFPLVAPAVDAPRAALEYAPSVGVLACALLAGVSFALNPLGDERQALPLVLLSGTDAAAFVRGRIAAGLALGLVPLAGAAVLGVAAGVPPASVGWLLGLGLALSVAGGGVAVGLGAIVPKYEPEEVFGVETVRPSNIPLFAYELGTLAVGGLGLLLVGAPAPTLEGILSRWYFLVPYAAVVCTSAALGYVGAVRRLRGHTVDG